MKVYSQANGFSQFVSPNFGLGTRACGCVLAKFFSQLLRRQTSPIGHMWSDDRTLLKYADIKANKPVRSWLTAKIQKKKYFCFSNRLFLQSRSPRVGRVGRCVFRPVFGARFGVEYGVNEEKMETTVAGRKTVGKGGVAAREGRLKRRWVNV